MHIPDRYLGPETFLSAYAVMTPFWMLALAKLKRTLHSRQVPMLALGAAFCFIIMMLNIPIPGSVSGHAVGAVLIAILLGPWAAVIAVSLALVVQALLFGDGGITAFAANALTMAVIMPFAGWGVYRLIAGASPATARRRKVAAAIGGYVGLNVAALATGVLFGIQPLIAHDAAGHALYMPFELKTAVLAMVGSHLLVFGFIEAIATGLVVGYFQRTDPAMLEVVVPNANAGRSVRRVAIGLGVLILLSPLGLYLPAKFASGSAWGEWSAHEIQQMVGYLPAGMASRAENWHAPLPDYSAPGQESASLPKQSLWYILSGVIGAGTLVAVIIGAQRVFARKGSDDHPTS